MTSPIGAELVVVADDPIVNFRASLGYVLGTGRSRKAVTMSWNPALEPGSPDEVGADAIETLIVPRSRDLGGFEVRRALPASHREVRGPQEPC